MKDLPEGFKYNLKNPIKYHKDGLEAEGSVLEISAPSSKNLAEISILDQEFSTAAIDAMPKLSAITSDKPETTDKEDAKDLFDEQEDKNKSGQMMIMLKVGGGNLMKCYGCLQVLLTSGSKERPSCTLDGIKLTTPMYDDISLEDKKTILGLYIANFIYGSLVS